MSGHDGGSENVQNVQNRASNSLTKRISMGEILRENQLKNSNSPSMNVGETLSFWKMKVISVIDHILHCWNYPIDIGLSGAQTSRATAEITSDPIQKSH